MKKALERIKLKVWHYKDGEKIEGVHSKISGNVSDISGNVSDISGNVTGISGDIDDCNITGAEREKGINISDLIKEAL